MIMMMILRKRIRMMMRMSMRMRKGRLMSAHSPFGTMPTRPYKKPRPHPPWYAPVDAARWARYMRGAWRRFALRLRAHANWHRVARIALVWETASRRILAAVGARRARARHGVAAPGTASGWGTWHADWHWSGEWWSSEWQWWGDRTGEWWDTWRRNDRRGT